MDRVIIQYGRSKGNIIKKCGNCLYGKDKDLQDTKVRKGWVYCIFWNGIKPFNGLCPNWRL